MLARGCSHLPKARCNRLSDRCVSSSTAVGVPCRASRTAARATNPASFPTPTSPLGRRSARIRARARTEVLVWRLARSIWPMPGCSAARNGPPPIGATTSSPYPRRCRAWARPTAARPAGVSSSLDTKTARRGGGREEMFTEGVADAVERGRHHTEAPPCGIDAAASCRPRGVRVFHCATSGRSAVWSARQFWVLEAPGSNPGAPTNEIRTMHHARIRGDAAS